MILTYSQVKNLLISWRAINAFFDKSYLSKVIFFNNFRVSLEKIFQSRCMWFDAENLTGSCNGTDSNSKPPICFLWYEYFFLLHFFCPREITILLRHRSKLILKMCYVSSSFNKISISDGNYRERMALMFITPKRSYNNLQSN